MDESRKIIVLDDEGKEVEMEIMFTFNENGKNYVVFFDPNTENKEIDVNVAVYDDEGNLFPVETDEEWEMIEEVIGAFLDDQESEE